LPSDHDRKEGRHGKCKREIEKMVEGGEMLGNVIWIGQSSLGQDGYVIEFGRAGDKCKRENDQMRETETGVYTDTP
jgi:hypothetical protein